MSHALLFASSGCAHTLAGGLVRYQNCGDMREKSVWALCANCSVAFEWALRTPRMCRGGHSHFSLSLFFQTPFFFALVSSGQRQPVRGARRKRTGKKRAESFGQSQRSRLEEGRSNLRRQDQAWRKERLKSGVLSASAIKGRLTPGSRAFSCFQYPLAQLC